MYSIHWFCLITAALAAGAPGAAVDGAAPAAPPAAPPVVTELDDDAQPLVPSTVRSGLAEDRVRSLALFAAARVAEQKQDYPLALRNYERAFRFDPEALPALREIVPLAFNLDRQEEAVRYALIMAERDSTDSVLLRRLAIYLTEKGETERALALYEKTLALHEKAHDKPSAELVLLWMDMGRLYFVTKKYEQAAARFADVSKALAKPSDYGLEATMEKAILNKAELTYQLFGESFLEANRPDDALAAFEKSQQIKADEAAHLYNLARVESRRKRPAQALSLLDQYVDKHFATQGTGPYHLMAEMLEAIGQQDRLIERLETYRKADPSNTPLQYFLAQRLLQAGELDRAEPIYQALVDQHKARPPIEAFQGLFEIHRRKKNVAGMLAVLGSVAGRGGTLAPLEEQIKPLTADAELTKSLLSATGEKLSVDASSLSYGQLLAAGILAVESKDYVAANRFFAAALKAENAKPSEALVTWGLDLFMANQYADAAKVFQRGLEEKILPENNPTLYFYLSGALEMEGHTDEAIEMARKAADLQKDSARFHSRAGWIEYHAKRNEQARKSYEALLKKFDESHDSPETRDAMRDARLVLSNLCVAENKLAESEEWLEQVLDEFPEDAGALNDLAYLWADSGKHLERAQQMIEIAVQDEPKNMAYRDSLGWVLFRLGKFPEAVAELKAAAGVEEPDGVILDHLAQAQAAAGDSAGATANWQRAADAFTKKADAEKAKQMRDNIERLKQKSPATAS